MPTFPYFNSGYLQEEIDWANHCREQEEAELKLKLAEQHRELVTDRAKP